MNISTSNQDALPVAVQYREAFQQWEAWWKGTNDGPILSIMFPRGEVDYRGVVKPWMSPLLHGQWTFYMHEFLFGQAVELAWRTGDFHYIDDAAAFFLYYRQVTGYAGEAYPFLFLNTGAAMLPALLTNHTKFLGDTIWVGVEPPWTWEQIFAAEHAAITPYAATLQQAITQMVRRMGEHFVLAPPELGGLLDVLSGLRGTQELLIDLLDEPDTVQRGIAMLDGLAEYWSAQFAAVIDPANQGLFVDTFRYPSLQPMRVESCDFSAMISPACFEEFYLPTLQRQAQKYAGRLAYHLDGPGQLPHVGLLCAQHGLQGVQWVYGAGNPDNLSDRWDCLYRQLLDAGKKIYFCSIPNDVDALRAFFRKFPARAFMIPMIVADQQEAEAFLRLRDSLR